MTLYVPVLHSSTHARSLTECATLPHGGGPGPSLITPHHNREHHCLRWAQGGGDTIDSTDIGIA